MHRQGAEMAVRQGDYRAIPAFTVPALERAVPKRDESRPPTQIAIVISPQQLSGLQTYQAPEVEVVTLPPAQDESRD